MANSTPNPTACASTEEESRKPETAGQWLRPSPIAILYFVLSSIKAILSQFIVVAPAVLVGYNSMKNDPWLALPIVLGILALLITSAILHYYFFQYRLSESNIEIRSGVISKKHINLPFSRIQNVKIERPIYYRLTGFACLILDTAGSNQQEAKLVAIDLNAAEKLKHEVMSHHQRSTQTESVVSAQDDVTTTLSDAQSVSVGQERVINTRNLKDLVIHGVTSNRIWIFLGVLAPFYDKLLKGAEQALDNMGIDLSVIFDPATHSIWQLGLYALSLALFVMFVLTLFSILGSIMMFYGFTLSKQDDRYIRRSGLFTKHEVSMRHARLQTIAHKRDWLDMLLKRVNLRFEQASSPMNQSAQGGMPSLTDKILVPSVTPAEALDLIQEVYPEQRLDSITFRPISKRFLVRYLGYILAPIYLALAIGLLVIGQYPLVVPLSVVFAFVSLLIFMRWQRYGYAIDDNYLYLRSGAFGIDHVVFPIYKVQQTIFRQSKFMKRRKLASVSFVLASGAMSIPFVPEEEGRGMINQCLYQVETSGKSWM